MSDNRYRGWYSFEMDERYGHCVYEDVDGKQHYVTLVNDSPTDHQTNWSDIVYVGPVDKCFTSNKVASDRQYREFGLMY